MMKKAQTQAHAERIRDLHLNGLISGIEYRDAMDELKVEYVYVKRDLDETLELDLDALNI